jgi:SPX domain protein involved in polyphosphate accumulation
MKRILKEVGPGGFNESNEAVFITKLEQELDKVSNFCQLKSDELTRRVQHCETEQRGAGAGFDRLEEEMGLITTEVSELSKFIRLNYSGFVKILKKHDKHTSYALKSMFMIRLNSKPFYKLSFDTLILRLSKLYDIVRTGGKRQEQAPPASGASFVRRTTKYWVHTDNITEVKIRILKNLPVLVFKSNGSQMPDPAISSIYFDNDAFELYQGRLEKSQGAQAIRLRWYGSMDQKEIFVERKTHHEDWTGETSVKARFSIKEKHVNKFLKGEFTMDKAIEKMRSQKTRPDDELDEMLLLANEVQAAVKQKGLKPQIRTFYNRTAFQLPGDARVRISLDTELTMIREDNYDIERSGQNWRRMDAGTIAPFSHLYEGDVCAFPYAVLEVKLQTQHGTQAPEWVQDLIESHLVEEVPKFSKFIHGVASLLESHISLLPFWLPQMDKDIRKPGPKPRTSLPSALKASSPTSSDSPKKTKGTVSIKVDSDLESQEDDEKMPLLKSRIRKGKEVLQSGLNNITQIFGSDSRANEQIPTEMNNKRIILPVRIEPKVFFANERTFLSWLHFCIVLGGLALGLLNFGSDTVGQISGVIFTFVSMGFMIYALYLYQWRAHKIRIRGI